MERKQYTRRKAGDCVNGAVLIERVNGRLWKMKCSCGELFVAQPSDSKGVCRKCAMEKLSAERTKHGESPKQGRQNASKLYSVWVNMRNRCFNSNNKSFVYYGGRGISVCDEWNEFLNFEKWVEVAKTQDELKNSDGWQINPVRWCK